jgi:hypothetical protein
MTNKYQKYNVWNIFNYSNWSKSYLIFIYSFLANFRYGEGRHTYETIVFFVRFEVFTAVTMKNAIIWDVAPCRSCVNRLSFETSVHTRSKRRHIPEDGILRVLCVCLYSSACVFVCVFPPFNSWTNWLIIMKTDMDINNSRDQPNGKVFNFL